MDDNSLGDIFDGQNESFSNGTFVDEDPGLYKFSTSEVVIVSIFYGLISLTAFIGNSLVIYVVIVSRRMQTVTNMYITNLAFADVTIALFAIPFQFHASMVQRWDLPAFMCQFCPFVACLSINISIFTLVAISLDRYRAIMYPLRRKPTKLFSKIIILIIWVLGLAFAVPMGIVYTFEYVPVNEEEKELKPFCHLNFGPNATNSTELLMFQYYSWNLLTVQYFLPMAIISVAYARIAFQLWGGKPPGEAQEDRDHNILANKKKVIKMLFIVVCIFCLCWLPFQVYLTMSQLLPQINNYRYINVIFFCCHWLAMSNSCYNPFIYGIFSEKFRREFAVRLPCLRSANDEQHPPRRHTEAISETENCRRNRAPPRIQQTPKTVATEVHQSSNKTHINSAKIALNGQNHLRKLENEDPPIDDESEIEVFEQTVQEMLERNSNGNDVMLKLMSKTS